MSAQTKNQYSMQDPTKQYPQPKSEDQPQFAPGLAQESSFVTGEVYGVAGGNHLP